MFGRVAVSFLAIGAISTIAVVAMAGQAITIKSDYTRIPARITEVDTDCYVEKSYKEKVVEKGTKDRAYMTCEEAPEVAVEFGFTKDDVQQRAKVTYAYISPVDSATHTGTYERNGKGNTEALVVNKVIYVHAHKQKADDSRTTHGNFFIEDTGV